MKQFSDNEAGVKIPAIFFISLVFAFFLIPNFISAQERTEYGWKIANYSVSGKQINLTTPVEVSCKWTSDPNWKNCSVILEVFNDYQNMTINRNQITRAIDVPTQNLVIRNTTKFTYYNDSIPTLFELETNFSCQVDADCPNRDPDFYDYCNQSSNKCVLVYPYHINVTRKAFDNFTLTPTQLKVATGTSAIKFDFQVPRYAKAHFNLSVGSYTLDPDVSACGELGSANTIYTLTANVNASNDCFNITADNVTLDCNGYQINFSYVGAGSGVRTISANSIIKDCVITQFRNVNSGIGISLIGATATNTTIFNNTITPLYINGNGISLLASSGANISSNNITSRSTTAYTVYFSGSANNTLDNNIMTATGGNTHYQVYLVTASTGNNITNNYINSSSSVGTIPYNLYLQTGSTNNLIKGNKILSTNTNAYGVYLNANNNTVEGNNITTGGVTAHGIYINGANDSIIKNNTITTLKSGNGIHFTTGSKDSIITNTLIITSNESSYDIFSDGNGINNFTNSTFNKSDVNFTSTGSINVFWYAQTYVNDSSGNPVDSANVTVIDVNSILSNYSSTNSTGYTPIVNLREYRQNATASYFDTNYSFNATKDGFYNNESINLTGNRIIPNPVYITLTSDSPPKINFTLQSPADLNLTNFIGVDGVNITYNITDDIGLNLSTIKLYYKSNSSTSNVMYYLNGTSYEGYFSRNYADNVSSLFRWNLLDNNVLPASYNFPENEIELLSHTSTALSNANSMILVELYNVSNTTQYGFFEVMLIKGVSTGGISKQIYCNSTYNPNAGGNVNTDPNCYSYYSLIATTSYNHNHTVNSAHQVIPFPVNETSGLIGTVKVTSHSYFTSSGSNVGTWSFYHITNTSRTGAMRTTTNNGVAWTNQTYTIDAHLHQFDSNESLWYYACANDTAGNMNCSPVRQDLFEIGGLNPSSPMVYSPTSQTYTGTQIWINYTASESPNGYLISYYNISLLNSDFSFNKTIKENNSNSLVYNWNTSTTDNGQYIVRVQAFDNISHTSYGFSENFTINYTPPDTTDPIATLGLNPVDYYNSTSSSIVFDSKCSDNVAVSYLQIWTNKTGTWASTSTQVNPTNNTWYNLTITGWTTNGTYNWGVRCNDTSSNIGWSSSNRTLSVFYNAPTPPTTTASAKKFGYDNLNLPQLK